MSMNALIGQATPLVAAGGMTTKALASEPWRCVTALTLHTSAEHLQTNAICFGVFGLLCARRTGLGVTVAVAVAGGGIGNALDAYLVGPSYTWIGASTAVFALAGATAAAYRSVMLVILGVALVVMSHGADINTGAHALGLMTGLFLGLLVRRDNDEHAPMSAQLLAGATGFGALAACWSLAVGG